MSKTLVEVARDLVGTDSLQTIREWDIQRVAELAFSSYTSWSEEASPTVEVTTSGSLRPVLTPSAFSVFDEVLAARRCLLSCGSVVLNVPDSGGYARRMMRMLVSLEDAIDSGLVHLIPDSGIACSEWFGRWAASAGDDDESPAEQDRKDERAERVVAGGEIATALDLCVAQPETLNLACVTRTQVSALHRLLAHSLDARPDERVLQGQDALYFLPRLMEMSLPNLTLSSKDLVAVQRDGLFDDWQRALIGGIARAQALRPEELIAPELVAVQMIKEELSEAARRVTAATQRSGVLRAATVGSIRFGFAAAAGALGALGGPLVAAGAASGAYLLTAGVDWLGGRPTQGQRAFGRLAVEVFDDPREASMT